MTRLLVALVILWAAFLAVAYVAAARSERHPLLVDAKAVSWCGQGPDGPLIDAPGKYDYQLRKRRIGAIA